VGTPAARGVWKWMASEISSMGNLSSLPQPRGLNDRSNSTIRSAANSRTVKSDGEIHQSTIVMSTRNTRKKLGSRTSPRCRAAADPYAGRY
jgi:hypothetical protein